jgi:hypothetical protein
MQMGKIPSFAELEAHNAHQLESFVQLMAMHSLVPDDDLPSQKLMAGFWEAVRKLDPGASIHADVKEAQKKAPPKGSHSDPLVPPALASFRVLSECVKDVNGDDMRQAEWDVQKTPLDVGVQLELRQRTGLLSQRYAAEVTQRVASSDLTKTVMELVQKGNDSFRQIYDIVWANKIANTEVEAISRYTELSDRLRVMTRSASRQTQPTETLVELYVEAALIKPHFDALVEGMGKTFEARLGITMVVSVCPTLKKTSRMVEKGAMKAKDPGNMKGVKDIVRAMVVGKSMAEVNAVIEIMLQLHEAGDLEIVRMKDRFLEAPSGGGWRDIMVNVLVTSPDSTVQHICEVQVVHHQMLNARKKMDGHVVYNIVRNGE